MMAVKAAALASGRISVRIAALASALILGGPANMTPAMAGLSPDGGPVPETPSEFQRLEPRDAARIKYTTQRFVYLDVGETTEFPLRDGRTRRIRLVSVRDDRDSVIGLARRADVGLEIDGEAVAAVCAPYAWPVEKDGLRFQVDTTSAWLDMGKRVQLSLWDAAEPVVDTSLFGFPLRRYALFSQGTQGYNEPVHLGHGDGDPRGQRFHHNYGFDMAGFEGRDEVLSPIDGLVIEVKPADGWLAVEDDRGVVVDCGHMDAIRPEIRAGTKVVRGQPVGMVGRKGPSGNYSHLHLGLYLSRDDYRADRPCRNLNLYPWIAAAYRAAAGNELLAVARPHRTAKTGERVLFDGRDSLAFGGRIVSYRWEFSDGSSAAGPVAEKAFDRPGVHTAVLRIEDDRGRRDADICRARIYTSGRPEDMLATLFFTASPTGGIKSGDAVHFRGWPQGGDAGKIHLDFGDGSTPEDYEAFADAAHRFDKPGLYIVTARAEKDGRVATEQLKIVVSDPTRRQARPHGERKGGS